MAERSRRAAPRAAPARRPRHAYHHGDLPRALLDAAREIIGREGADAFTLRAAARAVGVDHAAAYRHFDDKRALLAALARQGFVDLQVALERALAAAPATGVPARVHAIGAALVRFALDDAPRFRVMFGQRLNVDGRFPELEQALHAALTVVTEEMRRGLESGTLHGDRPIDLAFGLWTMAYGFADLVLQGRIKVRSRRVAVEYFGRLAAPFVAGLQRPAR